MKNNTMAYISTGFIAACSLLCAVIAFSRGAIGYGATALGAAAISLVLLKIKLHLRKQKEMDEK